MHKKILSLLILFILLVAACSNNDIQNKAENKPDNNSSNDVKTQDNFPVTLNIDDKEVIIEKEPMNILPMSLEVAEIVLELTSPNKVVATTRGIDDDILSTKSEEAKTIEKRIGAATNIDAEEIVSLQSDLLIMTKMYGQEEEAEEILSQFDIPILAFSPFVTVEKFQNATLEIGKAMGKDEEANQKVDDMKRQIKTIQENIPEDGESPTVLVLSEVGGDMGPFMLGPTNISYDLVKLAGGKPATDLIELERSGPAEIEQIIKMDPDYIVLLDFFGKGEASFQNLMKDPAWKTLQAVKEDKIMLKDAKYILNPNFENVKGIEMLVDFIYE